MKNNRERDGSQLIRQVRPTNLPGADLPIRDGSSRKKKTKTAPVETGDNKETKDENRG